MVWGYTNDNSKRMRHFLKANSTHFCMEAALKRDKRVEYNTLVVNVRHVVGTDGLIITIHCLKVIGQKFYK